MDKYNEVYEARRKRSRTGCLLGLGSFAAVALALGLYIWLAPGADPAVREARAAEKRARAEAKAAEKAAKAEAKALEKAAREAEKAAKKAEEAAKKAETEKAEKAPETPQAPEEVAKADAPAASPAGDAKPADAVEEPKTEPPPPAEAPAAPLSGAAATALDEARAAKAAGDLAGAREKGLAALEAGGEDEARAFLNELAMPLLASKAAMPEKLVYTIAPGDSLSKIAAKFNTPVTLIQKANGLHGANIRTGYDLMLLDGNNHVFSLVVSRQRNIMDLLLDGKFFKRYRVGTGVDNSTPLGTYKIVDKLEHPPWWRGDGTVVPYTGEPGENLLGTHWLAWDLQGFGIHGTWEPETVGSQSSAGCVRLKNEDVEELFTILPRGTVVTVGE